MRYIRVNAEGVEIGAKFHAPNDSLDYAPLVVAVHGGTYTSAYFEVAGSPTGSFVDTMNRAGLPVLTVDRPCYGSSATVSQDRLQFHDQAALLNSAVGQILILLGYHSVALVGHSIGGMISLEMAAAAPRWDLTSLSLSGVGARLAGNAAHSLAQVAVDEIVDLPVATRESVFLGPPATCTARARRAAHSSYSPAPRVEFHQAPEWVARLPLIAGKVAAPIHHVIAELDVLWDSSDEAFAEFAAQFRPAQVCTERLAGAGHSIDHHLAAAWFHLRQCAFILEHGNIADR
jgi:pimeloyl-ACP methyl ester carboxylesterase